MTGRRTAWVVGTCVVMLLAAAAVGVVLMREVRAEQGNTWDSYRVSDRGLVVHKRMRACDTLEELAVIERRGRVEVTVDVEAGDFFCGGDEQDQTVRIRLADPLGRRDVYDGACLESAEPRRRCERGERPSRGRDSPVRTDRGQESRGSRPATEAGSSSKPQQRVRSAVSLVAVTQ